jgi:TatA/E family protein of Tat protein translocase
MFGTLGGPELLLILVIALIVFGPRKLPEIGKSVGKMMAEFRRASNDFKRTIEEEVEAEKRQISPPPPPPETVTPAADNVPYGTPPSPASQEPAAPPPPPEPPAAPAPPAPPEPPSNAERLAELASDRTPRS